MAELRHPLQSRMLSAELVEKGTREAHRVWWLLAAIFHPRQLRITLSPQITP